MGPRDGGFLAPPVVGRARRRSGRRQVRRAVVVGAEQPRPEFQQGEHLIEIKMRSAITVDGAEAYVAAALSGLGLIQVPAYDVRHLLERGDLKEILPDTPPPSIPLSFLFTKRRNLSPKVRVFLLWLESVLERHGVISQSPTQRESIDKSA